MHYSLTVPVFLPLPAAPLNELDIFVADDDMHAPSSPQLQQAGIPGGAQSSPNKEGGK